MKIALTSIMESMSYGKPVIGSNIGGIPELVNDGKTGRIFQSKDVQDLATKINWLLARSSFRDKFSRNAIKFAEKNFNGKKYYKKLVSLYDEAIK